MRFAKCHSPSSWTGIDGAKVEDVTGVENDGVARLGGFRVP